MPGRFDVKSVVKETRRGVSKRLVGSYLLDWIAIVCLGMVAAGISQATPHYRNFSVLDLSISFPLLDETVPAVALAFIAGVIPLIIFFVVILFLVPGPATWRNMSKEALIRWKLWEMNVAALGLALTHVTSQLLTQGTKNVAGKPRPDMLARCMPDVDNIGNYRVGGYGQDISPRWIMVDQTICTQTNMEILNDGFRSFPSGHATTSWAGMLFLSLWLASKFGIWFPQLPLTGVRGDAYNLQKKETRQVVYRDEGAAPPAWLLWLIFVPLGVAIYVTGTRFFEYYHFGFDLISGSLIGIVSAWFSFRWYNLPLGRSAGWAWGPRSRDRAFAIGVGRQGWVSEEAVENKRPEDIEMGGSTYQPYTTQTDGSITRLNGGQDHYHEVRSSAGDTGFSRVPVAGQPTR